MKNVRKIIALLGGEHFTHCKIESRGYMPLTVEAIGTGPRGLPMYSVCHYGEQNGDLMADPEMTFEEAPDGKWHPVSFRNDYMGFYQEGEAGAVFQDENGRVLVRPKLIKELESFARMWNKNIGEQGFVEAAGMIVEASK